MSSKNYLNLRNVYRKTTESTSFTLKDHGKEIYWVDGKPAITINKNSTRFVDQKFISAEHPSPLRAGEISSYFGIPKYEARFLEYNIMRNNFKKPLENMDAETFSKSLELPLLVAKKEDKYVYVIYQRYEYGGHKILKTIEVYSQKEKAEKRVAELKVIDSRYEYLIDSIKFIN